jgi:hypothetical protein
MRVWLAVDAPDAVANYEGCIAVMGAQEGLKAVYMGAGLRTMYVGAGLTSARAAHAHANVR